MSTGRLPLLSGSDAHAAEGALTTLSSALVALPRRAVAGSSLAHGHAGMAVVHAHLARSRPDVGHDDAGEASLRRAVHALARERSSVSLFRGFTGVAWAIQHLARVAPSLVGAALGEHEEALDGIDSTLVDALDGVSAGPPFDLFDGLAGVATYALSRLPRPSAERVLVEIVAHLESTAVRSSKGIAWPTSLPSGSGAPARAGFNMGVAHGTPGLVPVLAATAASGVAPSSACRELLQGAVEWVAHNLDERTDALFAGWVDADGERSLRPARSAWCYGAPGIAAALLAGGRAVGDASIEALALRIARRAAARPASIGGDQGVWDAGLCHGAAGLGHVFLRIHRASGEDFAADAARRWFACALALREPARGVGGFTTVRRNARGARRARSEATFLTGSGGIALALAAALSTDPPTWDSVLALSVAL